MAKKIRGRSDAKASASGRREPPEPRPNNPQRSWEGEIPRGVECRADVYLSEIVRLMSRSQIKARGIRLLVNGKAEKISRKLKGGDRVAATWNEPAAPSLLPQRIDLPILHEDAEVFVFDKPQGIVTNPGAGNPDGTLANAAVWYDADRKARKASEADAGAAPESAHSTETPTDGAAPRGGIVHRLDKDTSGAIIVARDAATHAALALQFHDRSVRKEYIAICRGVPARPEGRIENRLVRHPKDRKRFHAASEGGKKASTLYKVAKVWRLADGSAYSLLRLHPRTGRTHQLRVHMAGLGCPILGDPLYGKKDGHFPDATLMLHARSLKIKLPSEQSARIFTAPLPPRFLTMMEKLSEAGIASEG